MNERTKSIIVLCCSAVRSVQCSSVQCSAVQCSTVQYSAVQCSAVKSNKRLYEGAIDCASLCKLNYCMSLTCH